MVLFIAVEEHDHNSTVSWPAKGQSPIIEFSVEGCIPHLIAYRYTAGFLAPRVYTITNGNYCKHLIQ